MNKDFNKLLTTFKSSIKTWDYFVNWKKVFLNGSDLEIVLNKLNYLLGKENLKDEFKKLHGSNPDMGFFLRKISLNDSLIARQLGFGSLSQKKQTFY